MRSFGITALLLLLASYSASAADLNGYTAQYECRAGGTYCDVDVEALANQACQQTISPPTPWGDINWSNDVICIESGDHRAKGPLTIPDSANGTLGNRKVLRYDRVNDNGDKPWNQSDGNRAMLGGMYIEASYWIMYRLSIIGASTTNSIFGTDNIIDSVLIENNQGANENSLNIQGGAHRTTVQNSVIRKTEKIPDADQNCIAVEGVVDANIVNNELYDCTDTIVITKKAVGVGFGVVIENNDLYTTSDYYTAEGLSCTENAVDIKTGATSEKPFRIIHNRVWGWRFNDTGCSATGASGDALTANDDGLGSGYILFLNNIVTDSYHGITAAQGTPRFVAIVGNILYNIKNPDSSSVAIDSSKTDEWQVYLNTIIDSERAFAFGANNDVRCNVAINGGLSPMQTGSGTLVDNNAFYNTASFTTGNPDNTIVWGSDSDSAGLEYCFNRKLLTGPELYCIPHAKASNDSPHNRSCNSNLATYWD